MTDKEFKRLSRSQLIEIIYQFQLKQEELTAETERLSKALADKRLRVDKAGNIAEAALDLGCTPIQALWKVIIPQIKEGIISGALVAFTMSFDDFVISLFTTGPGINNISMYVYANVKRINPTINALSAIIVYVITAVLLIINVVPMIRERKGKKNEKAVTL